MMNNMTFTFCSSSLVRDMSLSFSHYVEQLEITINAYDKDVTLIVFPEYCWRLTPVDEVLSYVNVLKNKVRPNLTIVLGTIEFVLNDKYTNNSIVIHNKNITYVPKTKILKSERERGLVPGVNPGIINIGDDISNDSSVKEIYKLGVLVCADLWEPQLLLYLAKQHVDVIAVPAWTSVFKGKENGARAIWYALAKATAAQYGIVVVVADHAIPLSDSNNSKYSIGNVSVIFSPDNRDKLGPNLIEHTNENSKNNNILEVEIINLNNVRNERERWREKGLLPLEI